MEPSWLTDFGTGVSTPELLEINGQAPFMASWIDTLALELESQPEFHSGFVNPGHDPTRLQTAGDTWKCKIVGSQSSGDVAEDVGIRLVHTLLMCAEAIQCGELQLATSLVTEMRNKFLPRVNTSLGIGKVAGYFVDGLNRRLYQSSQFGFESESYEVLYHHFYEACPYLKFAHFTANQAILEAFNGHDCVHVIDFGLINGLQWPALIQALALRPGGPPSLRLTAISSPHSTHQLEIAGFKLAELTKSINVNFTFEAVTASRLEELRPRMNQTNQDEALAVNSILQMHRLLGSRIEPVLEWIRSLNPKIMTVVEQEANLNQPDFLPRFTEALHYYSTIFDSLAACPLEAAKPLAELHLQREICNILCCEGLAMVERHEPLAKWKVRLSQAGFKPMDMGHNALKQARTLLTMYSGEGFGVEEIEGCLLLGWHDCSLIAASAWQVNSNGSSSSSSSS